MDRCVIKGYEIPPKTRIFINAWAIGRDSKYWKDLEKFNPERFEDSSIDYKGTWFPKFTVTMKMALCQMTQDNVHRINFLRFRSADDTMKTCSQ
uniref:Uncharacterized protein n=1 Tax=Chenopodium quinoa TaxID=63459 RepID=A0A803MDD3_CHEQI